MGSKAATTSTPDYTSISNADIASAQLSAQTSADSLAWAKTQYADEEPYTKAYMTAMTNSTNAETASAQEQQSRLTNIYYPMEDKFAAEASGWNAPARAAQQSAAAQADVASTFQGQRAAAQQSLEGYGIDPSQTRYGALDLGSRISQAASQAAAGTQSRLNTEATGLALQGEAINTGRGYASNIAQSYQTATGSGSAGVTAGLNTSSTYGNLMGTATQWGQLSTNQYSGASSALNNQYNNQIAAYNASSATSSNEMSGIGSLVGGVAMAAII
jgi:hypothetical protein